MQDTTKVPAVILAAIERQKIDLSKVNLILPTKTFGDIIGEFEKVTMELVEVDPDPKGPDVFAMKPSSNKRSLGKRPLMAMSSALNLQWDPRNTGGVERTSRMSRNKATAAMQKPNGQWVTFTAEKVIDLDAIEEELRKNATDDAEKGPITSWENNYPVRGKWKNDTEKLIYIDREVQKAMIQKKKSRDELADTGAHERVIRIALALKNEYTVEELKKPFAFPHIQIDTDKLFADPRTREAALNNMVSATRSIYGPGKEVADRLVAPEEDAIPTTSEPVTAGQPVADPEKEQLAFPEAEGEKAAPELSPEDLAREILVGYKAKIGADVVGNTAKGKTIHQLIDAMVANKKATLADLNAAIDFCEGLKKGGAA